MLKSLLVPYVNAHSESGPINAAIALSERFGSRIAVLITVHVPTPIPSEWGAVPVDIYQQAQREARERADVLKEKLQAQLAARSVNAEVRAIQSLWLRPSSNAAMHAHYADLCIVPSASSGTPEGVIAHDYFQDVLLDSGRPVLVVPPTSKTAAVMPARRAVIAWKPTREASRAVHDAMPLLKAAEAIDILLIDPKVGEAAHGEDPGTDIAAHLAAHGLNVKVVVRPRGVLSVAAGILEHARQVGADLIVAGGYGHSRLREFVLGGVTRELLLTTDLPILFSH